MHVVIDSERTAVVTAEALIDANFRRIAAVYRVPEGDTFKAGSHRYSVHDEIDGDLVVLATGTLDVFRGVPGPQIVNVQVTIPIRRTP